jgi:hypothetical protein
MLTPVAEAVADAAQEAWRMNVAENFEHDFPRQSR